MLELEQVQRFVEERRRQLEQAVGTAEFPRELDNLHRFWTEENDPARKREETLRFLGKYPTVLRVLEESAVTPATVAPSMAMPPPLPRAASLAGAPEPSSTAAVSPDTKLTYLRELVTGSIGVLIVLVALFCTVVALFRGNDMFPFLSGLVGVVLGYYFGRAPGEAVAAKAQAEVQGTRKELEHMAEEVRSVLDSNAAAMTRSATGGGLMDATQLERLRRVVGMRHAM